MIRLDSKTLLKDELLISLTGAFLSTNSEMHFFLPNTT